MNKELTKEELIKKKIKMNKYYNIIFTLILISSTVDFIAYISTSDSKYLFSGILFIIIDVLESIYVLMAENKIDSEIKEAERKERFEFLNESFWDKIRNEE